MEKLIEQILVDVYKTNKEVKSYSMLSLAFLGDGVHSLFVRSQIVNDKTFKVKELHSKTTKFVKASSQSLVLDKIMDILTEEELQIVKSSRNAKTNNIAKHSTIKDYKSATAFESLIGFLALTNNFERLNLILKSSYDIIKKEIENNNI